MFRLLAITAMLAGATACDLPRDPHKTLEHVRGHILVAGVSEHAPFLVRRGDDAAGLEADLIRGFARHLGAQVRWKWDGQETQLEELSKYQLDLVAGGLTAKTPWKKKVAVTRPYAEGLQDKHVFAVPPGENAFLLELEKFLAGAKP